MPSTSSPTPDAARLVKLGKLGELAFSTLATQADLVVNSSEQDEAGWDFVVELSPGHATPEVSALPIHTETFAFRGRVQVKSTDSSNGYVDVRLSNWQRMVDDPQPTYFAILEFDEKDSPQRVYVVHVGQELIRRVLRRFHQNAINEAKALNKITMRLTYDEGDRLTPVSGTTLRERLLAGMAEGGESWAGYATWKGRLVHTAGFEGGNVRVRVTVPVEGGNPPDPVALLSDLETGVVPSIEVVGAEMYRTRFGLVDPTPFDTRGPSLLQAIGPRPRFPVTLEVRATGTTARQTCMASIHVPSGLAPAIRASKDLSRFKTRLQAPHIEIVADFQNQNGMFHARTPENDEAVNARTVKLHAELATVVATAMKRDTGIEIEARNGADVIMHFEISSDQLDTFGDSEAAANVLGRYVVLCTQFNVLDEAAIALDEIEARQDAMRQFAAFAVDGHQLDDITFKLVPSDEGRGRAADYVGQRITVLCSCALTLGSHTFVVVLAAWGTLERVAEHNDAISYRIVGDPILRVARLAREGTIDDVPLWELITDASHLAKEREDTGRFIIIGVQPTSDGVLDPIAVAPASDDQSENLTTPSAEAPTPFDSGAEEV